MLVAVQIQILTGTSVIKTAKADCACVQGFNMAVQKASSQLPENPADLDRLIKARLNSDLKARLFTYACRGNPSLAYSVAQSSQQLFHYLCIIQCHHTLLSVNRQHAAGNLEV